MSVESGIYVITCLINGKVYVGSAVGIRQRWNLHRHSLNKGRHRSKYLQSSWEKYGAESFEFRVLEWVPDLTLLITREQHWIDFYRASNPKYGFNTNPTAGSSLGVKQSPEAIAKTAAAHRGSKRSIEARAKMSVAKRGRKQSSEAIAKRTAALRGRKQSPEHVAKRASARRKLDDIVVVEVRRRLTRGESQSAIAAGIGCNQSTISEIKLGRSPYELSNQGSEQDEPDWFEVAVL